MEIPYRALLDTCTLMFFVPIHFSLSPSPSVSLSAHTFILRYRANGKKGWSHKERVLMHAAELVDSMVTQLPDPCCCCCRRRRRSVGRRRSDGRSLGGAPTRRLLQPCTAGLCLPLAPKQQHSHEKKDIKSLSLSPPHSSLPIHPFSS